MPRDLTDRALSILEMLPLPLRETAFYQACAVAQAEQLDALDAAVDLLERNMIPASADEWLAEWATMFGVQVDPSATVEQKRTIVLAFVQLMVASGSGLDWEAAVTRLLGTNWSYQTHVVGGTTPPSHTINVYVSYDASATSAQVLEILLDSVTPANTTVNVAYSEGFILDASGFGDPLG